MESALFLRRSAEKIPMKAPFMKTPCVSIKAPLAPLLPPKENLIYKEEKTDLQGEKYASREGTLGLGG